MRIFRESLDVALSEKHGEGWGGVRGREKGRRERGVGEGRRGRKMREERRKRSED